MALRVLSWGCVSEELKSECLVQSCVTAPQRRVLTAGLGVEVQGLAMATLMGRVASIYGLG